MKTFDVAVVGATGAVGASMLEILAERRFPVGKVYALTSARSAGRPVTFDGGTLKAEDLASFDFSKVQIGLFSAGSKVSEDYAPRAVAHGCVVIDNTSRFRYDHDVPLVVPEVNAEALPRYRDRGMVANPNCSTIQMVVALKPIYDAVGIERINVATYQSVSGAGARAIEALAQQSARLLNGLSVEPGSPFPSPIAFNVLPHIDTFEDNGYTREEMKMVWETRKILGDDSLQVNATAVRVPVFYGHSEALHIETREKITAAQARALLQKAPGVEVRDEREVGGYPTAVTEAAHRDAVFVGRIREDISHPRGLDLWVVADNVRKGAALNAIQIAELLVKSYL